VFLVRSDNPLDQRVSNDVAPCKLDNRNTLDVAKGTMGLQQSGALLWGQVDLSFVACDNGLGIDAQSGQEHEHLLGGRVLGFIENNKSVV
jgi:hypothetical protein